MRVGFRYLSLPDPHPTSTRCNYPTGTRGLPDRILTLQKYNIRDNEIVITKKKSYRVISFLVDSFPCLSRNPAKRWWLLVWLWIRIVHDFCKRFFYLLTSSFALSVLISCHHHDRKCLKAENEPIWQTNSECVESKFHFRKLFRAWVFLFCTNRHAPDWPENSRARCKNMD